MEKPIIAGDLLPHVLNGSDAFLAARRAKMGLQQLAQRRCGYQDFTFFG
jgi:hypothetical protein